MDEEDDTTISNDDEYRGFSSHKQASYV